MTPGTDANKGEVPKSYINVNKCRIIMRKGLLRKKSNPTGFTLIELMVVIAIAAIIAAYGISAFQVNAAKAKVQNLISFAESKKTVLIEYASVQGGFPPTGDWNNVDSDWIGSWRIIRSSSDSKQGTVAISLTDETYLGSNSNKRFQLEGNIQADNTIVWTCGTRDYSLRQIDFTYLPPHCQNLLNSPHDDNP